MNKKIVGFPSYNVSLGEAILIVKHHLNDPGYSMLSKVLAIEYVTNMGTHNSVTKDDLIGALRWIFENYDMVSVL